MKLPIQLTLKFLDKLHPCKLNLSAEGENAMHHIPRTLNKFCPQLTFKFLNIIDNN